MKLVNVYDIPTEATGVLYHLLAERTANESISHQGMPHFDAHERFVQSRPYFAWYLIEDQEMHIGAIYLSRQREIGVGIFLAHRRRGYAKRAIQLLMAAHPGKFLANVNPLNQKSITLFNDLGFNLLQCTYAHE